jgi:hypothetical protein
MMMNSPWYRCKVLKTSVVRCRCKYVKILDTNRPDACNIVCVIAWNSINDVRCKTRAGSSEEVSCSSRAWRWPSSCGLKQNKITTSDYGILVVTPHRLVDLYTTCRNTVLTSCEVKCVGWGNGWVIHTSCNECGYLDPWTGAKKWSPGEEEQWAGKQHLSGPKHQF